MMLEDDPHKANLGDLFYVLGTWIFWGTYPVPFKSPAAMKAGTDPFIFQCMKSTCVFLTAWIVLVWKDFSFTWWGFVGSAIWVPAGLLFITSVKLTGVAFATPVSNGCQVIVSFCWGAFYFKEDVHNAYLSVVAIFLMIVGMCGISFSVNYEKMKQKPQNPYMTVAINEKSPDEETPLMKGAYSPEQRRSVVIQQNPKKLSDTTRTILGIICALFVGLLGGTQPVPLKRAGGKAHGIEYLISFGIGAVIIAYTLTAIYTLLRLALKMGPPTANFRLSLLPGSLAGLLWAAGNFCQTYVTLALGQTVGFPLVMCNMMVAGCWGVFYYNEAPSIYMKILFILSCCTLLGGVTMLSKFG